MPIKIQFTQPEIELMRSCFDRIASAEAPRRFNGLQQENPEWSRLFLLLRKLLAYGVYYIVQPNDELSYQELQKKTQKSGDMLAHVYAHLDIFKKLLTRYTAQQ